jgi:hypothetical protein
MSVNRFLILATVLAVACGGEKAKQDETARDLSLAPADSVTPLNDQPAPGQAPATNPPAATTPARTQPTPKPSTPSQPAAPRTTTLTAGEGTVMVLAANDTLTSRHNKRGETVTATLSEAVKDAQGRTVIPAGALFTGTITDLAPAEHPGGEGRMVLTFTTVEFGGKSYAINARTDSLGTYMKGRGVGRRGHRGRCRRRGDHRQGCQGCRDRRRGRCRRRRRNRRGHAGRRHPAQRGGADSARPDDAADDHEVTGRRER